MVSFYYYHYYYYFYYYYNKVFFKLLCHNSLLRGVKVHNPLTFYDVSLTDDLVFLFP